jgi:hypothetical protein
MTIPPLYPSTPPMVPSINDLDDILNCADEELKQSFKPAEIPQPNRIYIPIATDEPSLEEMEKEASINFLNPLNALLSDIFLADELVKNKEVLKTFCNEFLDLPQDIEPPFIEWTQWLDEWHEKNKDVFPFQLLLYLQYPANSQILNEFNISPILHKINARRFVLDAVNYPRKVGPKPNERLCEELKELTNFFTNPPSDFDSIEHKTPFLKISYLLDPQNNEIVSLLLSQQREWDSLIKLYQAVVTSLPDETQKSLKEEISRALKQFHGVDEVDEDSSSDESFEVNQAKKTAFNVVAQISIGSTQNDPQMVKTALLKVVSLKYQVFKIDVLKAVSFLPWAKEMANVPIFGVFFCLICAILVNLAYTLYRLVAHLPGAKDFINKTKDRWDRFNNPINRQLRNLNKFLTHVLDQPEDSLKTWLEENAKKSNYHYPFMQCQVLLKQLKEMPQSPIEGTLVQQFKENYKNCCAKLKSRKLLAYFLEFPKKDKELAQDKLKAHIVFFQKFILLAKTKSREAVIKWLKEQNQLYQHILPFYRAEKLNPLYSPYFSLLSDIFPELIKEHKIALEMSTHCLQQLKLTKKFAPSHSSPLPPHHSLFDALNLL